MKIAYLELEFIPGKEKQILGFAGKLVFHTGDRMTVFKKIDNSHTRLIFSDQQKLIDQSIIFAQEQKIDLLYLGDHEDPEPKQVLYCVDQKIMQQVNKLFRKFRNIEVMQEIVTNELNQVVKIKNNLINQWNQIINDFIL